MFRHYYAAFDMWFYDYYKPLTNIMVNVLGNGYSCYRICICQIWKFIKLMIWAIIFGTYNAINIIYMPYEL